MEPHETSTTSQLPPRIRIRRIAGALSWYKAFVLTLALSTSLLLPGFFDESSFWINFHWPPDEPPGFTTPLETWDAQHYLYLAEHGYQPRQWSIAFFPLWPLAIRIGSLLPGVGTLPSALLLANLFSLAAFLLLFRLADEREPGTAATALLLLVAFPGSLFFHFAYSESLFLFLAVAFFVALRRDRQLLAAVLAFLLPMTRPLGVLIAVPFAWHVLVRWLRRDGRPAEFLGLAAPLLGFGGYLLFMQLSTGDALAGFEMQRAFSAERSLASLIDVPKALGLIADVRVLHGPRYSFLDRLAFLGFLATLAPLWRFDRTFFWYALPMGIVPVLTGSFTSFTRFASLLFPCFLVVARPLSRERRAPTRALVLAVFLALQVVLLLRFASFRWAG